MINPPDGAWGSPDENGTWSGLIGHAMYGMSNWSFSGLAVVPEVVITLQPLFDLLRKMTVSSIAQVSVPVFIQTSHSAGLRQTVKAAAEHKQEVMLVQWSHHN